MEDKKYTAEEIARFFIMVGKMTALVLLFLWFGWKIGLIVLLLTPNK